MSVYLMSYPRPDWGIRGGANFLSSQLSDQPPNPQRAMKEWLTVADAIEDAGGTVLIVPPAPHLNLTGMPYTAEAGEYFVDADGVPSFVLPKMKSAHRQPEPTWIGGYVMGLGWKTRAVSVTWEAQGDAIRIGPDRIVHTHGKGPMRRTQPEAYAQVADLLSPHHIDIQYRAYPWFHGNTFMAAFHSPDQSRAVVMVCPEALMDGELERLEAFCGQTPVVHITRLQSLNYATNALQVGGTVLAPSGQDESITKVWTDLGLEIVELKLVELFRRGGGAAVCMSNRLYGLDPATLPPHTLYRAQRDALHSQAQDYPTVPIDEGW